MNWLYLFIAVTAEIFGTVAMKHSDGFQKITPTLGVAAGYGLATFFLSIVVKHIPVGIVYALWSAVGILGSLVIDHYFFSEKYSFFQLTGFVFIVMGAVMLNVSVNTRF